MAWGRTGLRHGWTGRMIAWAVTLFLVLGPGLSGQVGQAFTGQDQICHSGTDTPSPSPSPSKGIGSAHDCCMAACAQALPALDNAPVIQPTPTSRHLGFIRQSPHRPWEAGLVSWQARAPPTV